MERIRVMHIDTGEIEFAVPAYAYSLQRMRDRKCLLGAMQTHVFVRESGKVTAVRIEDYQREPFKYTHPMDFELLRLERLRGSAA